jgi:hypothetical protein
MTESALNENYVMEGDHFRRQTTEEAKLREELLKSEPMCTPKGYVMLGVLLTLLVLVVVFSSQISKFMTTTMADFVKRLLKMSAFLCYSIIFIILTIWMVLPLPGPNIFIMLVALAF